MSEVGGATAHEPGYHCGALARSTNRPCRQRAGARTDHTGEGRCWLHGGATPIKSGRYSRVKRDRIRELIASYESDPDPMDILPELAAARALFQDFLERYDEWREALLAWHESWSASENGTPKPRKVLDVGDAYRILSEITKIAARIERIQAQNAISRPELFRVMGEMGRVVERHVEDSDIRERIRDGWLEIRLQQ